MFYKTTSRFRELIQLNVPSMEFGIPLKEIYNDYRKDEANNATN